MTTTNTMAMTYSAIRPRGPTTAIPSFIVASETSLNPVPSLPYASSCPSCISFCYRIEALPLARCITYSSRIFETSASATESYWMWQRYWACRGGRWGCLQVPKAGFAVVLKSLEREPYHPERTLAVASTARRSPPSKVFPSPGNGPKETVWGAPTMEWRSKFRRGAPGLSSSSRRKACTTDCRRNGYSIASRAFSSRERDSRTSRHEL
mmetsp:Transcript_32416/g.55245  ORF Transcript_32416/g.55245 Transcript_32416/m.55245 type:complete len:209 (-) Transcript_32416:550-1176(-)